MPIAPLQPRLVGGFPRFVFSRDGSLKGEVTSTTRRCQLEGCNGKRLGVKWPDGRTTYPCTKGLEGTDVEDTWKIG